jgi:uncharacterized protein (DUF302 family)
MSFPINTITPAAAAVAADRNGILTIASQYDFKTMLDRVNTAIARNNMVAVAQASASAAAEKRGVAIRGDAVFLVFRNDFAVRMLAANTQAGLAAPIPIHVFEGADGTVRIAYRPPTAVFKPYRTKTLDDMAREMDPIFQRIVADATAQ